MKNMLYFIRLDDDSLINCEKYIKFLSPDKQAVISKYKFDIQKKLSLISDLFVRCIACAELKLNNEDLIFDKNTHGKPYLDGFLSFQYNVSHTKNAILVGFSEKPIGVDIEKIKESNMKLAKRFFSENELSHILLGNGRNELFYEIWTKKEAYIKWAGKGMALPLNTFDVTNSELCGLFTTTTIDDYMISACSEVFTDKLNIEILCEDQVLETFNPMIK